MIRAALVLVAEVVTVAGLMLAPWWLAAFACALAGACN